MRWALTRTFLARRPRLPSDLHTWRQQAQAGPAQRRQRARAFLPGRSASRAAFTWRYAFLASASHTPQRM